MSTKIYRAFRLKPGVDPFAWAIEARHKGQKNVQRMFIEFYTSLMADAPGMPEMEASNLFRKVFMEKDPPEVSICMWKLGRRYYLIPYTGCPFDRALDFLDRDRRLEDFSYYDNADPPEDIPYKAFKARGATWEKIFGEDEQGQWDRLQMEIFSKGNYYRIDPWVQMVKRAYRGLNEKEKEALTKERNAGEARWRAEAEKES